jgi:hypothetical protein
MCCTAMAGGTTLNVCVDGTTLGLVQQFMPGLITCP